MQRLDQYVRTCWSAGRPPDLSLLITILNYVIQGSIYFLLLALELHQGLLLYQQSEQRRQLSLWLNPSAFAFHFLQVPFAM